jgi:DDE superfamily endonuclease
MKIETMPTRSAHGHWCTSGYTQPKKYKASCLTSVKHQAHEWVHKLSGILNEALGYEKQLPEREPHRLEALAECPSLAFIIDGTQRHINRPQDKAERKQYYSGKQKTFTVKNNIISQRHGKVVFLSNTYEGKKT